MDRVIKIAWDGEQLEIKPTMELAHTIETEIGSVMRYITTLESDFSIITTCKLFSIVFSAGGKKVTPEQVYEELGNVPFAEIVPLVVEVLQKVFPMFFTETRKKKTRSKAKK